MKTDPPWASEQKENNNIDIKVKQTFHLKDTKVVFDLSNTVDIRDSNLWYFTIRIYYSIHNEYYYDNKINSD